MYGKLIFYCLLLFCLHSYANTPDVEVVRFSPELILGNSLKCTGIRFSNDALAMTTECIAADTEQKLPRTVVGALDGKEKGILVALDDNLSGGLSDYLGKGILVGGDSGKKIENPFSQSTAYFEYGINSRYTINHVCDNEVSETEVNLNKSVYPYIVTGIPEGLQLPSGSPIYDKDGKIQCLLVSDSRCTVFKQESAILSAANSIWRAGKSLLKGQREKRAFHFSASLMRPPAGDCCHPDSEKMRSDCIKFCAAYPAHCTSCEGCKKLSHFELMFAIASVSSYVALIILKPMVPEGYTALDF